MRHAFSACVYCMLLRFQSKYIGFSNIYENATACSKRMLKTRVATSLIFWYKKGWKSVKIKKSKKVMIRENCVRDICADDSHNKKVQFVYFWCSRAVVLNRWVAALWWASDLYFKGFRNKFLISCLVSNDWIMIQNCEPCKWV